MGKWRDQSRSPWDSLRDERLDIPPKPRYTPFIERLKIMWSSSELTPTETIPEDIKQRVNIVHQTGHKSKLNFEEIETRLKTILTKNLKTIPTDINEFKDPESGETQIIVTIPLDQNVEDPFEELDKLHAEISRLDRTLATKIILLPTEPTE